MAAEVAPTEPGGRLLRPVVVAAVVCALALTAAGAWLLATRGAERPAEAETVAPGSADVASGHGVREAPAPRGVPDASRPPASDVASEHAGSGRAKEALPVSERPSTAAPGKRKRPRKSRKSKALRRTKQPRDPGEAARKGVEIEEF